MKKRQHLLVLISLITLQLKLFGQYKETPKTLIATNDLFDVSSVAPGLRAPCNATTCSSPIAITLTTLGTQVCAPVQCNDASQLAGPNFAGTNCYDLPNPTIWYSVMPPANTATLQINVTSTTANPTFAVYSTTDCSTFTIYDDAGECYSGSAGAVSGNMSVPNNGTRILIGVSAAAGQTGNFTVCVTPQADNSSCNVNSTLTVSSTSMGSPLNGPYQPGETVNFCYKINQYTQAACNWLQGIVPTFGNCWDPSSFTATGQPTVTTSLVQAGSFCTGAWAWWPSGSVLYNSSGANVGAGWFFSQPAGTDPDNSWGDANGMCSSGMGSCDGAASGLTWQVCFSLKATTNCATNPDCSVSIKTYADGEIGTWTSLGCVADQPKVLNAGIVCCLMTVNAGSAQSVCSNSSIALNGSYANNSGATTVAWTSSPAGALAGLSSTTSLTPTFTPPAGITGAVTFTLTATDQQCTKTNTVVITVNPAPAISNQTSTICSGTAFTVTPSGATVPAGTTYTWTAPTLSPAGSITGSSAQATGQTSISQVLTNTTTSTATATYTVTPTAGTCAGNTFTITVTVNPKPVISNQTSTICSANAFTVAPTGVPVGTTYTWTAPTISPAASITGSSAQATGQSSISQILTNTTTSTATATYTVTPTSGTCAGNTFTIIVTVNPVPVVTNQTSTICSGAAFTTAPAGVPAGTTYTWTAPTLSPAASITGSGAQGTGQANISQTLTNTTTSTATATYTVTPTSGTCAGNTFTIIVTVNPTPVVSNQTSTICSGNAFTVAPAAVPAGTTYTWTAPTLSPAASITGSSAQGTGQTNISQTLTNTTTSAATATYTVTPTSGTCAGNTFTVAVTVNPKPVVSNQTSTTCSGTAFTVAPAGVPAGTTYTWTAPTLSPAASITGSSAQGTGQATISQTLTNTTTSVATATYTVTPTSGTCAGNTFTVTVTVNPTAVVVNQTAAICTGNAFTVTPAGVPAGTTYTWTAPTLSPAASITGSSAQASGQTNISQVLTNTTTSTATATYTVTPTTGTCVGNTFTITVTVNANPVINTAGMTITPASCGGSDGAITGITATGTATLSYAWNGGAPSTVNANLSGVPAGPYTLVVTNGNGCSSTAGPFSIANPGAPAAPVINPVAPVCAGQSFTVSINSPNGSATYTWTGPNGALGTGTSIIVNNATTADAGSYSATATISGCTGPAGSTTVVVNSIPATPTPGNNGPVCVGASLDLNTNTVGGATYSWTGPNAFSSGLEDPNVNANATLTMAGTYSLTVTVSGCTSAAGTTTVVVNPIPSTPAPGNNGPVCVGSSLSLNTATVAGATYAWTGPSSFSSALEDPAVNASATAAMAGTYSLTVTVSGCISAMGTTTVVVNPIPSTPAPGNNGPVCVGTSLDLNTVTVAGATYAWTGPNGFSSALEDPNVNASATVAMAGTYSLTVTVSGCTSAAGTTTVVVNPIPSTPAPGNNGPVCEGSSLDLNTATVAGATYAWTGPNGFSSALEDPNVNASATVAMAGTYSLTVTVSGCTSAVGTTTVVVNPIPAAPAPGNNGPVCAGSSLDLNTATVAGATYAWTGPNGFSSALEDPNVNASATAVMAGTYSLTVTVSGCTSATGTTTVVINPLPAYSVTSANPTTCGGADGTITLFGLTVSTVYDVTYSNNATVVGPASMTSNASGLITITGLSQGTYTNIIATLAGCSTTDPGTYVLTDPSSPVFTVASSNPTTCGGTEGTITLSGLTANIAYNVSYTNGAMVVGPSSMIADGSGNIVITGLSQGSYTNVTAGLFGCNSADGGTYVLTDPPAPVFTAVSANPTSCNGTDGTITLSGLAAGTSYSITYSDGATVVGPTPMSSDGTGNIVVTGLAQGSYTNITVSLNGCSTVDAGPYTLTDPAAPTFTVSSSNPTTCGGADGAITISGLTANTAYNVAYSNGATVVGPSSMTSDASGNIVINVPQGSYSGVTVSLSGCSTVDPGTYALSDPGAPAFTVSSSNPTTCGGTDGSLTLSGLTANTTYSVSYFNGSTVVGPASMTSDASGNITITGLPQGSYSSIVVSLSGCNTSDAGTYALTEPALPVFTVAATNPTVCGNADGTLTLSGLIASTSYNVTYSNGATVVGPSSMSSDASGNIVISGLSQGSYNTITVSLSGCNTVDAGPYVLSDPGAPLFTVAMTNPTTCGGTDGTITLSGLTVSTAYNITYSNGAAVVGPASMTSDASGNIVISGLSQGSYTSIIANLSGCSTTAAGPYTLTDPGAPAFTVGSSNPTTCGGADGTLTLSGLTVSTSYSVTYSNGATVVGPSSMTSDASGNIVISGLSQGSYTNIIVSLSGCNTTDAGTYALNDPGVPAFTVASSNPTTCGAADGAVTLSGLTANTSYSVTYSNGATVVGPTAMTSDATGNIVISGLTQGTYTNIIVSISGCSTTDAGSYVLTDPAAPSFTVATANPTTCGGSDGTITLSGLTANTSYSITYSNGATVGPVSMTSDASGNIAITGLSQGSYTNIIVSQSACSTTDAGPHVLTSPGAPTAPTASGAAYCAGAVINPITAVGTGGTYTWYDDAALTVVLSSGSTYTPVTGGTHTYYVTETNGTCQSPATAVTITINPLPTVNAGAGQTLTCSITTVSLDGSLSSAGTYSWAGPGTIVGGTTATPSVNAAGTYTLTVIDGNSCSSTNTVVVTQTLGPVASFSSNPSSGFAPLNVSFTNSSQNANTYIWSFGDSNTSGLINPTNVYSTPGTYNVMLIASDNLQCPDTAQTTIVVFENFTLIIPNVFTPGGDNINDQFVVTSKGVDTFNAVIYDRWGLKLFEWNDVAGGWDGRTTSGTEVPDGTYYYMITAKGLDGTEHFYKGYVQLLR